MSGAWPVRTADLAWVYSSALGMKLSFTGHCGSAFSNAATRSVTHCFLAGSSGQLLHMVMPAAEAVVLTARSAVKHATFRTDRNIGRNPPIIVGAKQA